MRIGNIHACAKRPIRAHGGVGSVQFARLAGNEGERLSPDCAINFIDAAILMPGSSVGPHEHEDSTEAYLVLSGTGQYLTDDQWITVVPGDVLINHRGRHSLRNESAEELMIYVIETGIVEEKEHA